MRKIVGKVCVMNSSFSFPVMWDTEEKSSWLGTKAFLSSGIWWRQVCSNVMTDNDALSCAQKFVDVQYGRTNI